MFGVFFILDKMPKHFLYFIIKSTHIEYIYLLIPLMYISLSSKSKTPHTIHIIDKEHHKKLPENLQTYVDDALVVQK